MRMEPAGQFDGDWRRLDLDMHTFARGSTAHYGVDVTVASPTKGLSRRADGSWAGAGAREPGKAAAMAEDVKDNAYPPGDLKAGQVLLPASIEAFGRLGNKFTTLLRELAEMAHVLRRWPRWYFWDKWAPKIGACLAEGNHIKAVLLRAEYSNRRVSSAIASVASCDDHWDPSVDLTGPAEGARPSRTRRMEKGAQRSWLEAQRGGAWKTKLQQRALRYLRPIDEMSAMVAEDIPARVQRRAKQLGLNLGPKMASGKTRRRARRRRRRHAAR